MKKILLAVFALMMVSSSALAAHKNTSAQMTADTTAISGDSTGSWVLQAQTGLNVLASSAGSFITFGGAGYSLEGSLGYAFSKNFTLSLLGGYDAQPANIPGTPIHDAGLDYTAIQMVGQYNLGGEGFCPYFTLGAGIAMNVIGFDTFGGGIAQSIEFTETDLLLSPGLGVSFPLADKAQFFVQGRVDIDFFSSTYANFVSGLGTKKFDTPQIFIPIQAGLSFDVK